MYDIENVKLQFISINVLITIILKYFHAYEKNGILVVL
jgi:hypothetical protein